MVKTVFSSERRLREQSESTARRAEGLSKLKKQLQRSDAPRKIVSEVGYRQQRSRDVSKSSKSSADAVAKKRKEIASKLKRLASKRLAGNKVLIKGKQPVLKLKEVRVESIWDDKNRFFKGKIMEEKDEFLFS